MSGSKDGDFDNVFDALRKWYADHSQPLPKKEAHDFSEIKKGLWQIKGKKISHEAKTKEMLAYLQQQKAKHSSRVASFVLVVLTKQAIAPNAKQPPAVVSEVPTQLIQLKQMLIANLPSGPNVVEKSLEGNHLRVHFPSGKLESTYRFAALKDTLSHLKIAFTQEKTHGSIPIIVLDEKSANEISDWQSVSITFKEKFSHYVNRHMNSAIDQFQSTEESRGHQQRAHKNILEAAVAKIKEQEQKVPVTGAALEQRTNMIKHILTGIENIKSKKLGENDNKIALDRLLNSAGHNVQNAEVVKIMHQVQEDLHLKGVSKPGKR